MGYRENQAVLPRVMGHSFLSAGRGMASSCVFACVFYFSISKCFRVDHAGTRGEENSPSRMEEIGIREPDG